MKSATAHISVGDVNFTSKPSDGLTRGSAYASIRYERIRVGPVAETLPNKFAARIKDVIFSGAAVQYVLRPEGTPLELLAETRYDGSQPLLNPGDTVQIGWDVGAARLFPGESTAGIRR